MKKELRRILCCSTALTLALTAFAGCNTGVTMPFTEMTMPPMGTTTDAEDAEEETTTDADPVAADTSAPSEISDKGTIGGLDYQIGLAVSGQSPERGFYVRNTDDSDLPFAVIITAGEFSTGGYSIEITDVRYDGSELVIVVKETAPGPTDMVTEAFTYPCCGISLSFLPETIKVIDMSGNEFKSLDFTLNDAEIEDGWIAVISGGSGEIVYETYVYETADGRYRYVNVTATTVSWGAANWNRTIDETGTVDTRDDIADVAAAHNSAGFVRIPGDSTVYSMDDFISGKIF